LASHTRVDEPAPSQTDLLPADAPGRRRRHGLMTRVLIRSLSAGVLLVLAVVIAWIVDMQLHSSRVVRNVKVGGVAVGGLGRAELTAAVERVAVREEHATVTVRASRKGFTVPADALRFSVRRSATVESALDAGHTGALPARVWRWVTSFFSPHRARVAVGVDRTATYLAALDRDKGPRRQPVEPSIAVNGGRIVAVPGRAGRGVDSAAIIAAMPDAATRGLPLEVTVGRSSVPPRFSLADAQRVAAEAEMLAGRPLAVTAGKAGASLTPAVMRSWMRAAVAFDGLRVSTDPQAVGTDLAKLLSGAGDAPVDAGFRVSGGSIAITPSKTGTTCCAPEAVALVDRALRESPRPGRPLELPLAVVRPARDEARAGQLGVKEMVATFTTHHPAGQPRVANIHKMADYVRGAVIEPGKTFSVNDHVGRRTIARGFVDAPIIGEGNRFDSDVGGGVSQFATTAFNAAFFAGLEIPEYQFHTIYISRYPYGREGTLAFPHPDLKIKNTSPYGVLVWTSYSGTDITVTLYSTKWVEATQSAQFKSTVGAGCTAVTTQRTRTFVADGHTEVDKFSGTYVPGEGARC
jgi:vancomycin resistance protein YoaR